MTRARGAAVLAAHPRHAVLLAVVAGLVAGGWAAPMAPAGAALAGSAVLWLGGRAVVCLLVAGGLLAGALVADARRAAIDGGTLPAAIGTPLRADVVLLERPRARASGELVARARVRSGRGAGEVLLLKARRAAGSGAAGMLRAAPVGRVLAVSGRVEALREFDEIQRRRGALAALSAAAVRDTGGGRTGLLGRLDRVRERARAGMAAGLAAPQAALAHGMVLGEDADVDDAVREQFQVSGLAHLLAASGTNVMLLATLALGLGALLGVPLRPRLGAALLLVAAYVPLAGGGPSIQRAGVMGAAGLVAALAGRPASRWYAIGLAAAATLALNPYAAADPGWQLSFAAVLGLMLLGRPLGRWLARPALPRGLTEAAAMTVAATLATAPLLALHFERVSIASLPANVLAAPAVAPLMWLGTLAGAVGQAAPGAAIPLNALNAHLLGFVGWVAGACAALPAASLPVALPGPGGVLAAYGAPALVVAGAVAVRRRARDRRCARPACRRRAGPPVAALATALALVLALWPRGGGEPARPGETVVSFLDVGQGDATLVQRDGASVLFDTGPPDGPLLRRLRQAGVRRLDALVITHAQADHEGAAVEVIERLHPRLIVNGGAGWPTPVQGRLRRARHRARIVIPEAGARLAIGALELRILWPPRELMRAAPEGDPNARAVVAHLRSGELDVLLPADAESDVQLALDLPRAEILKVAHHGSADAGLPLLLDRIRPAVAAIEVGRGNGYGHPAPEVLAALRSVPQVFRTDRDGTIRLRHHRGAITATFPSGRGG